MPKRNSMSEISLAWLMSKVTSPVVGATKLSHIDTACKACDLKLTVEEMKYLEECYKPHPLVGVMKENNQ
ncbi:MAG: aldo/keto reductase [Faecalibacillus faecis]